jgi:hypothetical protein
MKRIISERLKQYTDAHTGEQELHSKLIMGSSKGNSVVWDIHLGMTIAQRPVHITRARATAYTHNE